MASSMRLDGVGAMRGVGGVALVLFVDAAGVCSSVLCSREAIGLLLY